VGGKEKRLFQAKGKREGDNRTGQIRKKVETSARKEQNEETNLLTAQGSFGRGKRQNGAQRTTFEKNCRKLADIEDRGKGSQEEKVFLRGKKITIMCHKKSN